MKIGCIIQGDVRKNTELVCQVMLKHFDLVIFSTWEDENTELIDKRIRILKLKKPGVPGYGHRNYQRYSAAEGIRLAEKLGCNYVLKWRSDMIPANLDISILIKESASNVPKGINSRIMSGVERCITCHLDYQSSLCDFYAFGHIEDMKMLWGDEDFDYEKTYNLPKEYGVIPDEIICSGKIPAYYCSEAELYTIFKSRVKSKTGVDLQHSELLRSFFWLVDVHNLGVIWFGNNHYRPILSYGGGWTKAIWKGEREPQKVDMMVDPPMIRKKLSLFIIKVLNRLESYRQEKHFKKIKKQLHIN